MSQPLVSCLCVSHDRVPFLRRAVACYQAQTYPSRELLVVHDAEDLATAAYLATVRDPSIRPVVVPAPPRPTLGTLRNLSLQASQAPYIAIWDDDDWHAPTRLAEQLAGLRQHAKPACVLWRLVLWDMLTEKAYLSRGRTWEGSLVSVRTAVPFYAERLREEDAPVLTRMWHENQLFVLDRPQLYIYVYHGRNTWERTHWEHLLSYAKALPPADAARVRLLVGGVERPAAS